MPTNRGLSVIIPPCNEAARIGPVVRSALGYADQVVVVDDGQRRGRAGGPPGQRWLHRSGQAGVPVGVGRGVVTMDADGEHRGRGHLAPGEAHPSWRNRPGAGATASHRPPLGALSELADQLPGEGE
ncbi:MAG: hypothetical protein ACETWR_06785 [Anaerolineae bacterium]